MSPCGFSRPRPSGKTSALQDTGSHPRQHQLLPSFWLEISPHIFHLLGVLPSLCVDPFGDPLEGKGAMVFLLDLTVVDADFPYLMFALRTEPRALSAPPRIPPLSYLPGCYLAFDSDLCLALAPTTKAKLSLEAGNI